MSRGFLLRRAMMVFATSWILVGAFSGAAYAATQFGAEPPRMDVSHRAWLRDRAAEATGETVTEAAPGAGTREAAGVQLPADSGTGSIDTPEAAGYAVGVLAGYVGILTGIAYFRDPLRKARRRARPTLSPSPSPGPEVRDVSVLAQNNKKTAIWRLVVQLIGSCVAAYGAYAFLVPHWYVYLVIGLAIVWAGGRFLNPGGSGRESNRAILAGSRRLRVTLTLSLASALVLLGLASVIIASVEHAQPLGAVINGVPVQTLGSAFGIIGFTSVAIGAIISRLARRLAAIDAHQLMLRDARPPVLYLRSFGDDRLKLLTATLGRPSLIERFTPRRFDTFEEVLARHLSHHGPVIALNPPGTKLAPLGAARETIDSADWQSVVAAWMARSVMIVFVAPPRQVTQGLHWELETVSANRHWHKTLIVVPPVPPEDLHRRWRGFLDACARLWPFTSPLPAQDPRTLVVAFRNSRSMVITADRRTEWSYSAALKQALDDSPQPAPVITVRCRACGHDTRFMRSVIEAQPLPRCGHCNHEMRIRSGNDAVARPESAVVTVRCGACGHKTQLPRARNEPQALPRCSYCNHQMRIRIQR
jgi:predicted nucleic acid-binding Zn ribbon protein